MSYIIGSPCVGVCDTVCVDVCPVDCIHGPIDMDGMGMEVSGMSIEQLAGMQLYINPEECIDCGACLPECPVKAIYPTEQHAIEADDTEEYVSKNYEFFNQEWKNTL